MPLSVKLGSLSFLCTCRDSHSTLVCEDAIAVKMLFDSELKVPDNELTGQINVRERPKLTNPFNADSEKERKMRKKEKKVELEKPVWRPSIERVDADVQDSVAGMVAKTSRRKLQVSQPCFMSVSIPAK
jgi:hypothetical protein